VQDINRIGELRQLDHPERARIVPNPNLLHASANDWHVLGVVWLFAALHLVHLDPASLRTLSGKARNSSSESPKNSARLIVIGEIYKNW